MSNSQEEKIKSLDSDGDVEINPSASLVTPAVIHPPPTQTTTETTHVADDTDAIESIDQLNIIEIKSTNPRSRSKSPAQRNYTQSPEVECRILTQMSTAKLITDMHFDLENTHETSLTAAQISASLESLKTLWNRFSKEHDDIPRGCDYNFLKHPYIKNKVYDQTCAQYMYTQARLNEMLFNLTSINAQTYSAQTHPPAHRVSTAHLPKLSLQTFDGNYSKWKPFKDMFTALIIQNSALSDVERLHYLKSSLKGDAEQFVSHVSIDSDSFTSTWQNIVQRFENKRVLIATHMDSILNIPTCTRTASALNKLIITVNQALDALKKLGSPVDSWDQFIVHILTMKLDSKTRENWQLHLGSQTQYPTLEQFTCYLTDTARALEQIESSTISRTQPTQPKPNSTAKAHVATSSTKPTQFNSQYPCDHCQGQHYIVSCAKFRELTPRQRMVFVKQQRLCFNCMGHHSVAACRSTKRCTYCSSNHHSMLHVNDNSTSSTQPTQSTTTINSPSTSSSQAPAQ